MSDRFSFDAIYLCRKEEANKCGDGAGDEGSYGGWGGLGSHEELDVAEGEGGGDGICTADAVLTGLEDE